jgi:hypothetical protein
MGRTQTLALSKIDKIERLSLWLFIISSEIKTKVHKMPDGESCYGFKQETGKSN